MNILAIVGSPRVTGNTNYLVDQALEEASRLGANIEKIILSKKNLSPCFGHLNCGKFTECKRKDDGMSILQKFAGADGLILASPVYYYDVSAWMKIFIDRNYFLYTHDTKCKARAVGIIVVAAGEGISGAVRTLKMLVEASNMDVAQDKIFVVRGYADRPGEIRNNTRVVQSARDLGEKLVDSLRE